MPAIELRGVSKEFGDLTALHNLDLTIPEGEVFGFLGPNGAGKSTTINVLLDFVRPSAGEVRVLGRNAREQTVDIRRHTGVLPEGFAVYDRLTGRQHVEFALESKDLDRPAGPLLERVGLSDAADRRAGEYSTGMRQRLGLAIALAGDPDLLILDEPSTGLDPNGARRMRSIVREQSESGTTVFFSSHLLGQVEAVCDRVGILRDGRMVAEDSVEGLRASVGTDSTLLITTAEPVSDADLEELQNREGISGVSVEEDGVVAVSCSDDEKTAVLSTFENRGHEVTDFETVETSLDELFAAYTEEDR